MAGMLKRMMGRAARLRETLWLDELYLKRRWYIVLMRIAAIFSRGVRENSLFSRAAALSFSSLLALAPILGIVVLLSASFLRINPEAHIKQALLFIAPSMSQYVGEVPAQDASRPGSAVKSPQSEEAQEMRDAFDLLIARMVEGVKKNVEGISKGGKGVAGVAGGLILIWMGITLLVAVENAMNDIWGVKRGRAWDRKIVLYWAVLSLGILLSLGLVSLSKASTLGKIVHGIPLSAKMPGGTVFLGTALSLAVLTLLLTFFYKFFPNTRVRFFPALAGGLVAALMLVLNNTFSMMYIRSVLSIQSLYGSVGIILVLMLGLYFFWAFLLLGGQLTYAVQNAQFLADQKAWENASERARETTTFAVFVLVSRRFTACEKALSSDEIAENLRVPGNIVNESLSLLCDMGLVTALEGGRDESGAEMTCFTPARPLKTVTFASFRRAYASHGADRGVDMLRRHDPLVDAYRRSMESALETTASDDMESLIAQSLSAREAPAPASPADPAAPETTGGAQS